MPAAIPVIIAIATATSWVQVALIIVSAAYNYYSQSEAERKARNAYNASLQDRRLVLRGGTSPRRWALGRVRVGGTLVYADTVGINKRQFDSELALCNGPIDAIEGYWLNDEYFPASEVSANRPTVGKYSAPATQSTTTEQRTVSGSTFTLTHAPVSGSLAINMDLGADNGYASLTGFTVVGNTVTLASPINNVVFCDYAYISADAPLLIQWVHGNHSAAMSWPGVTTPNRGAADKGLGVAAIRTLMGWDENLYQSGAPVVNALVRGIKVPDPRTGTTVWTSNPALLAAWFATLPRAQGGCGRPAESINTASVIAAANICDELITVRKRDGSGYEQIKRYECHTVLSTDASPEANLRTILDAMAGEFPFTSGQYVMVAGAFRAPTLVLTDADVAAGQPIRISPNTGGFEAIPNTVTATFADAAQAYVETSAPDVVNDAYVDADGGAEEPWSMRLLATTDARQANYLMGVALERSRPGFAAELTVKGVGANIALLQGVMLSLQGYEAFSSMTWEVRGRTNNFDGTYTLRLAQTKANIWALDADRYTPTSVPAAPDLSYLWSVQAVPGLAVVADAAPTLQPDGTAVTRVTVSWGQHPQAYVLQSGAIELRHRLVQNQEYTAAPEVPGSATGTTLLLGATNNARYIIEARARNGVGAVGVWSAVPLDIVAASVASLRAELSMPAAVVQADAAGAVASFAAAAGEMRVYSNTMRLTTGVAYSVASATNCTVSINAAGAYSVSGMTADTATATLRAVVLGSTFDLPYTVTKARRGADGAGNITWTTRGGMVMNGTTATKVSGVNDWNGEVATVQGFAGGCYVSFTMPQIANVMVGLNTDPQTSPNYQSIDYAIHPAYNGVYHIYENGTKVLDLGSYSVGDRFEVRHSAGYVSYYRNGDLLRSVALSDSTTLYADSSIYTVGASVTNLVFGPVGAKGADGADGADGAGNVTWTARGGMAMNGTTATKTSGNTDWDGEVATVQGFAGGCYVSFTMPQIANVMVGLNTDPQTSPNYQSIDYAIHPAYNGVYHIYENGTKVLDLGSYSVGDRFEVRHSAGYISYYRNGALLRSVALSDSTTLYADSSIYTVGASVTNLVFGPVGAQGAAGASAPLLVLQATAQTFAYDSAGSPKPAGQTITLTAALQNVSGMATFTARKYNAAGADIGALTLGGSGNTRTIAEADFSGAASASITAALGGLSDTTTVIRVQDGANGAAGADAIVSDLSNDSHTLPATSAGVVTSYDGAQTAIVVYRGTAVDTANWALSKADGPNVTSTLAGNVVTITSLAASADSGYVDITATRSGFPTQTKRFTLAKSRSSVGTSGVLAGWFAYAYSGDSAAPYENYASVTLESNGSVTVVGSPPGTMAWYAPFTSGVGGNHWVNFTRITGSVPDGAAMNTWLPLSNGQTITLSGAITKEAQIAVNIASDAAGANVIGSGLIQLVNEVISEN